MLYINIGGDFCWGFLPVFWKQLFHLQAGIVSSGFLLGKGARNVFIAYCYIFRVEGMEPIQIRMTQKLIDLVDELVQEGTYSNRSEAIRDAIRRHVSGR